MEQTHLKIVEENSDNSTYESKDNPNRTELLWTERQELLIKKYIEETEIKIKYHYQKGKKFKREYALLSIPSILIPLILSSLNNILDKHILVRSGLLLLSSIAAGLNSFRNPGSKYEKHFNYQSKYEEFNCEMELELSKPKTHRAPCDVYIQKSLDTFNRLNSSSPL